MRRPGTRIDGGSENQGRVISEDSTVIATSLSASDTHNHQDHLPTSDGKWRRRRSIAEVEHEMEMKMETSRRDAGAPDNEDEEKENNAKRNGDIR